MAAPRSQDNGGGGVTYVVGGNPVNMRRTDGGLRSFGDEKLSEKLGRSRAERKKRKLEAEQADQVLNDLLGKDGGGGMTTGGKYLAQVEKANAARVAESDKAKGKDKGKGKADQKDKGKEGEDVDPKRVFSAGAIRKIGFDPTARRGERDGEETQKRVSQAMSLALTTSWMRSPR
jgi:minichromosome maintenance protein 10